MNLRALLADKRVRISDLARRCGVGSRTLSRHLAGGAPTRRWTRTLPAIALGLGVPLHVVRDAARQSREQGEAARMEAAVRQQRTESRRALEKEARRQGFIDAADYIEFQRDDRLRREEQRLREDRAREW